MFDYAARQRRLYERMEAEGVSALFLGPSADLEYLAGVQRGIPHFGEASYQHGWVNGGFFAPGKDPVFIFPRMFDAFDLPKRPEGEVVIVNETDDGLAMFEKVARSFAGDGTFAVGDRVWAETTINIGRIVGLEKMRIGSALVNHLRRVKTQEELDAMARAIETVDKAIAAVAPKVQPGVSMAELAEEIEHQMRRAGSRTPSFPTHIFTGFEEGALDNHVKETAWTPITEGTSVMFDFGGVVDGYCSDFGRTVYCGEPPADLVEAYEVMLAAQEAGGRAAVPGAIARDVNAACRKPIEDAGYGEWFRHRMGHGIGMDVHERPFISDEDETVLEAGMTFTNEPSIMIPNRWSIRIEDIYVCEEGGARNLNATDRGLVANKA
ncbi:MAG: aminopeptidase P family protein [Solirubrobacteraceae bacterium]|nr:aminopeptidase P family protein [Solirubrobacteraceae bacterium]